MPTIEEMLSRGWAVQRAGKAQEAEALYRQALAADPMNASGWCYLGMSLHDQQRYEEAVGAYRRAVELKADFPIALNNLGNSYRLMRRLDAAINAFDKAIAIKPDYLIAFKNKATTLCWEGRVADALKTYEQAVRIAPNDPDTHKHIGIMRLLLGDFSGGWPEYDWRWKTGEIAMPQLSIPMWDGSPLDGKSILLTPEQGLGDTIHFIRYAAWLKERYACQVLFQCPPALQQLLASCQGIDEWVESLADLPAVDCFAPLLQVPMVLGHTPREFPSKTPYLHANESLVDQWRGRLAQYTGRKIGIAWRGSPTHQADVMRSIPLSEFAPLMRLTGVQFFSLQKGPAAEELNTLAGRLDVVDLGREIDENTGAFVETAAVLKNLDLLIACDTAIAHVAGALGVPVWVALCNVPDWRWLASGETTPWYPTMRLFRQQEQGDWASVLDQIAAALLAEFTELKKKQPADYRVATSGFNRLTRTRQGLMLYDRHDTQIGRSIELYGEYAAGEANLFKQVIRTGWTVLEVGANVGAHTVTLSRLVGARGAVIAFEPRRLAFQTLCANIALNSITNVHCRPEALSDSAGRTMEPVGEKGGPVEPAVAVTLDSMEFSRCQFLKIDAGGMELEVLKGGAKTIQKHRPLLYVAGGRGDQMPSLVEYLRSLEYTLYLHRTPLFDPQNFYQYTNNEFGDAVSTRIFGVHSSVACDIHGLTKIEGPIL
jgi:FkbM family methyltransferase